MRAALRNKIDRAGLRASTGAAVRLGFRRRQRSLSGVLLPLHPLVVDGHQSQSEEERSGRVLGGKGSTDPVKECRRGPHPGQLVAATNQAHWLPDPCSARCSRALSQRPQSFSNTACMVACPYRRKARSHQMITTMPNLRSRFGVRLMFPQHVIDDGFGKDMAQERQTDRRTTLLFWAETANRYTWWGSSWDESIFTHTLTQEPSTSSLTI